MKFETVLSKVRKLAEKAELQQLYYDALIELEDRRRNYW